MAKFDKRLADILVKREIITREQADENLKAAGAQNKSLSEVLVATGAADERVIAGSVAAEMNLPPLDLDKVTFDPEAVDTIPQDMAVSMGVLPIARLGNMLTVAIANPFDILKLDDIQLITHCEIRPVISTEVSIRKAILRAYNPDEDMIAQLIEQSSSDQVEQVEASDEDVVDIESMMAESASHPIIKLVNMLILRGIQQKSSDIHIEPMERMTRVRFRTDGVMHEDISPPKKLHNALISRIKVMAGLDIAERKLPQDGKFQVRVQDRQVDFRVSILPVVHGEKAVLRILDKSNLALNLDELGWEPESLRVFREAIRNPWGMVLVVGPTGCGKTTTLYSSLREVASVQDNLITVEDPVEYQLDGINQVQVNPKRGRTFAGVLRSILRQDPDIVMVGEIRDLETAEIAIQAALTGHLVLSTLHTNDAASTITRLVDMGIDPFMVAASVILVLAQRLCRKLCESCRQPANVPVEKLPEIGFLPEECDNVELYDPKGCPVCVKGYKGRFAVVEPMPLTENIKKLVLDGAAALDLKQAAIEEGMITLRRAAILNAIRGKTSLAEVLRVTMED